MAKTAAFTRTAEMGWAQVKYSMQAGEAFFTVVLEDSGERRK